MPCKKTGCQIYLRTHNEFLWCDAFEVGEVAYFRCVDRSRTPYDHADEEIYYIVDDFDNWLDKDSGRTSTIITNQFKQYENRADRLAAFLLVVKKGE